MLLWGCVALASGSYPRRTLSESPFPVNSHSAVPPVPPAESLERWEGTPYALTEMVTPTIGWQFLPRKKGGPARSSRR